MGVGTDRSLLIGSVIDIMHKTTSRIILGGCFMHERMVEQVFKAYIHIHLYIVRMNFSSKLDTICKGIGHF